MRKIKFMVRYVRDKKIVYGYYPNDPMRRSNGDHVYLAYILGGESEIYGQDIIDASKKAYPEEYAELNAELQAMDHRLTVVGEIEPPRVIEILPFSDEDLNSRLSGFAIQPVAIVDGISEEYVTDDKADFWEVYVVRGDERALLAARCPSRDDAESVYFLLKSVKLLAEKALLDRLKL